MADNKSENIEPTHRVLQATELWVPIENFVTTKIRHNDSEWKDAIARYVETPVEAEMLKEFQQFIIEVNTNDGWIRERVSTKEWLKLKGLP